MLTWQIPATCLAVTIERVGMKGDVNAVEGEYSIAFSGSMVIEKF